MADLNKAIKDLHAAGHTRKDIKAILGVSQDEIVDVLGKDGRGRKPKAEKVEKASVVDVICIDQSQSMSNVASETAKGVNQYIADMKAKAKESGVPSYVGVVIFGYANRAVKMDIPITEVSKVRKKFKSVAEWNTPLNDGLILGLEEAQEFTKTLKGKVDCTVTVFTDGWENASINSLKQAAKRVQEFKKKDWTVAFVGPQGSKDYAESLNVDASNVLEYNPNDKKDFTKSYNKMSNARSAKTDAISVGVFDNASYFVSND